MALSIAGSDSGGGAGVQADLKTFTAFGVHGVTAITCITAQNPRRVLGVEPCSPKMLRLQLEAIVAELPPRAAKLGMLFSAANVRVVADFFSPRPGRARIPLVIDPVLVSTSGSPLLAPAARKLFTAKLLPLAALITPNLDEAEMLLAVKIRSLRQMRAAARELHLRFGCAVLLKGGHLRRSPVAVDVFHDGANEMELAAPRVTGVRTHGTGCTYSAAICAALALGNDLPAAVRIGKRFVTAAIANSYRIGAHHSLLQRGQS